MTEKMNITGQHVLVIGTENPWLEALILEAGARKVTTLGELKQFLQNYYFVILKINTFISQFVFTIMVTKLFIKECHYCSNKSLNLLIQNMYLL